ncbi:MAG: hypothetical protein GKS05_07315 [Nitrospirales bacterium]|nr:hypothetical protein [Nitrospirales bacterium]
MTAFYLRWGVVLVIAMIIVGMTVRDYEQHLASVSPAQILDDPPHGDVRVQGLVKAGTLQGNLEEGFATFALGGDQATLSVEYKGLPPENLRELKLLIVVGQWDPASQVFRARELALLTHYGFVVSAYLVGLLPLLLVLFFMGRKVSLLFEEIKQSKLYQSE